MLLRDELTTQQEQAIDAVKHWYKYGGPVFELMGWAGVGKTTLAKYVAQEIGNVVFVAFVGKAVHNLSLKGCEPAHTVHKAIYRATQNEVTGKWTYSLNREDSPCKFADLVILDEGPMVGKELALDLLKVARKVLVLGDPFQLPPVNDEAIFGVRQPDFLLTDVHRQAKDSPVIQLATMVREGQIIKPGDYGTSQVLRSKKFTHDMINRHEQILVGKNDTRHFLNQVYRKQLGLVDKNGVVPVDGEKLICLRNEHERGFLNGSMWVVKDSNTDGKDVTCMISPIEEPDIEPSAISTPIEYFSGHDNHLDWRIRKNCNEFCYGYAITTHKAQGSQFKDVMIFDQSKVFKQDAARWLYTSITRAQERVTIFVE